MNQKWIVALALFGTFFFAACAETSDQPAGYPVTGVVDNTAWDEQQRVQQQRVLDQQAAQRQSDEQQQGAQRQVEEQIQQLNEAQRANAQQIFQPQNP